MNRQGMLLADMTESPSDRGGGLTPPNKSPDAFRS